MNTGFYSIFAEKLRRQKQELKEELERAKSDRRKDWIRRQIKETKSLQKTVREMESKMDIKTHCPHCGGSLSE